MWSPRSAAIHTPEGGRSQTPALTFLRFLAPMFARKHPYRCRSREPPIGWRANIATGPSLYSAYAEVKILNLSF